MRRRKATIVSVGEYWEPGLHPSRSSPEKPTLQWWHMTGGDFITDPNSDWPLGGYHLDELRDLARANGTYYDTVRLNCLCGHSIADHPTTNRDYWTGDADSPCERCGCLDYDGEGYPAGSV